MLNGGKNVLHLIVVSKLFPLLPVVGDCGIPDVERTLHSLVDVFLIGADLVHVSASMMM